MLPLYLTEMSKSDQIMDVPRALCASVYLYLCNENFHLLDAVCTTSHVQCSVLLYILHIILFAIFV